MHHFRSPGLNAAVSTDNRWNMSLQQPYHGFKLPVWNTHVIFLLLFLFQGLMGRSSLLPSLFYLLHFLQTTKLLISTLTCAHILKKTNIVHHSSQLKTLKKQRNISQVTKHSIVRSWTSYDKTSKWAIPAVNLPGPSWGSEGATPLLEATFVNRSFLVVDGWRMKLVRDPCVTFAESKTEKWLFSNQLK